MQFKIKASKNEKSFAAFDFEKFFRLIKESNNSLSVVKCSNSHKP
jgi:hypothetical protein